jgi:putative transposase
VEQTYYRRRKQYGGMGTNQVKELKRLQKESDRLRRAVSDLTLEKLILSEAARGNFQATHVVVPVSTRSAASLMYQSD